MPGLSFRLAVGLSVGLLVCAWGLLLSRPSHAQQAGKYWIFLEGKPGAARMALADEAMNRRRARGLTTGRDMDRHVSPEHLRALGQLGITPIIESRWLNAVSAELSERQLRQLDTLSFVRATQPVASRSRTPNPRTEQVVHSKRNEIDFGASFEQLALMNAVAPLENDINGSGVRIGFLDAPYGDFEHPAFSRLRSEGRLIAVRDFVGQPQSTFSHGLSVASVAVGYDPGMLIGPAHGAEVLAAITEYGPTETNAEEDFFVAGIEWLESMGADVISISLGYTQFDVGEQSYSRSDLDGDTGITTRAADMAAELGVVVVVSAGNAACSSPEQCWYYVGTPADGDSVITVGAVRPDSIRASFSSLGPTADGRVKPDVAAMGTSVYVAEPDGYGTASGTSFSAPLVAAVACQMLQVNPDLSPMQVRDILRGTAHRTASPDVTLGWGIVNADAAVRAAMNTRMDADASRISISTYPNPATDVVVIHINAEVTAVASIAVHDVLGRRVLQDARGVTPGGTDLSLPLHGLASGLYVAAVTIEEQMTTAYFVLAP